MTEVKRYSLVKPTLDTCFHIDFEWWGMKDRDWRVHLYSNLCPEHQELFSTTGVEELVDWVDPITAEVQRVNGMQHLLITHCAKQPGFITDHTALVDAVFRVFLSNGNIPMNSIELGERLKRQPLLILRTLSGVRVYKGIRPCPE